jgi:hypothetical protein
MRAYECRYWCRSRRNINPEEDLGLDRLLESPKKSKASGNHIVVIAEGDKIGKKRI